jgi:hypothetical protein
MDPLIDDLLKAWTEGVMTYDQAKKTNFKMHVWYMYSLHDMPAYGLFWLMCPREVPLPNMQGSPDVHLVEKGWEVFFIRQTSTIPPS